MSRIGRQPVKLPAGVSVDLTGDVVKVKGKHGVLEQTLPPGVRAEVKDGVLHLLRAEETPRARAMHGLARSLIANNVKGVTEMFEKRLEIVGIGYRAAIEGKSVKFNVGHSHAKILQIPTGIEVTVANQTMVTVRGVDKQQVGQIAANIRDFRRPGVYKGKGIRYAGEIIRQKVGKSGAK